MRLRVCIAPRVNACQSAATQRRLDVGPDRRACLGGTEHSVASGRRSQSATARALRFVDLDVGQHGARALEQPGQPLGAGETGRAQPAAQGLQRPARDERPRVFAERRVDAAISRPAGWVGMTRRRRRSSDGRRAGRVADDDERR
jgi:hypothetical protein